MAFIWLEHPTFFLAAAAARTNRRALAVRHRLIELAAGNAPLLRPEHQGRYIPRAMSMRHLKDGEVVRCPACRGDALMLQNLKGRVFPLRDEDELALDVDVIAPTCGACGEVFIKGEAQGRLSAALERLYLARPRDLRFP